MDVFEKIAEKIITTITEPFMLLALMVIVGLYKLLLIEHKSHADIFAAIKDQTKGLSECNTTLSAALTLIEVVVYGKDGKKV